MKKDELKINELKEALKRSKEDSATGRVRSHEEVIRDVRKKLKR